MSQPAPVYKGRLMRKSAIEQQQAAAAQTPAAPPPPGPEEELAQARASGERIIEQARQQAGEEAARIIEEAREEARLAAAAILEDAERRVARRVIELTQEAQADLGVTQPIIAELVVTSLSRILEGFDDVELVRRVVARGIADLRENRRIIVRVHPDDYSDIRFALWKTDLGFSGVIDDVEIDNRLEQGQLILDTGRAQVDVGVKSQLKLLREYLLPEYAAETLVASDAPGDDESLAEFPSSEEPEVDQ